MIDKRLVEKNFSRQAKEYDKFANVQKQMAERLTSNLPVEKGVHRILEVGCGTGYVTERLLAMYPDASIIAVDIAEGMIAHVSERFASEENIEFICGDIEAFIPNGKFDLIVSNAAFQWLCEPERTMATLFNCLAEEGSIHFTTLGSRTFHELHASCKIAADQLGLHSHVGQAGPEFLSLDSWRAYCKAPGIRSSVASEEMVEYFPTARHFLRAVKKIGANSRNSGAGMGTAVVRRMLKVYDETFQTAYGVSATYEVFHAICLKEAKACSLTTLT